MFPRTRLEARLIRQRLAGKSLAPVRDSDGKAYRVSTRYRVLGPLWSLGYHTGEDYAAPIGALATAVSWGKVIAVGETPWGPAYGLAVIVRHGRYDYAFCHLSSIEAKVGQKVRPGTIVGRVGMTGNVTGPHLHFEARHAGGRYGSDVHPLRVRRRAPR